MRTLGLHMIARNSEKTLYDTLSSFEGLFDQIIVVDTGSTDNTIEVAKSFGAEVYEFPWVDDFSAARNVALSKVTCDWAMWLDTGDIIKPHNLEAFKGMKQSEMFLSDIADLIWVPINRKLDDNGNPLFTMVVPRIARMTSKPIWERPIHETIRTTEPEFARNALFDGAVIDDPFSDLVAGAIRNLRILDKLIAEGDDSPRTMFYRAQELRDLGRAQEAIDQWTAFVATDPQTWEYYDALMNIGRCYYNRGDDQLHDKTNAAGVWLNAIGHDPDQPDAWFSLATLFYEAGMKDKALPLWQATLGMTPDPDGRPRNQMMYKDGPYSAMAFAYSELQLPKEALKMFREANRVGDDHHRFDVQIGEVTEYLKAMNVSTSSESVVKPKPRKKNARQTKRR